MTLPPPTQWAYVSVDREFLVYPNSDYWSLQMTTDPLLMDMSFVTYLARDEHCSADGKMVRFWDRIEDEIRRVADEFDLKIEGYRNGVHAFRRSIVPNNSGRCAVCNKWVSAQNRPDIIIGLGFGAEHDGNLYCLRHLSEDSDMYAVLHGLEERPKDTNRRPAGQ